MFDRVFGIVVLLSFRVSLSRFSLILCSFGSQLGPPREGPRTNVLVIFVSPDSLGVPKSGPEVTTFFQDLLLASVWDSFYTKTDFSLVYFFGRFWTPPTHLDQMAEVHIPYLMSVPLPYMARHVNSGLLYT